MVGLGSIGNSKSALLGLMMVVLFAVPASAMESPPDGDPFIAEIRMFAGSFAPRGWAFCDGRILAIRDNEALFSIIGTSYGGNGRTTFALPDLRGSIPVHGPVGYRGGSTGTVASGEGMPNSVNMYRIGYIIAVKGKFPTRS